MSKLSDVIDELKHTTVAQVVRQVVAAIIFVTPIWLFAGPVIESYADEAFVKMMTKSKPFADITKKVDELATDNDTIKGDIGSVKRQNEDLLKQQERTTRLVERLLEIQLRRNWQ